MLPRNLLALIATAVACSAAQAQSPLDAASARGFSSTIAVGTSRDQTSGWTTELNSSLRYDFGKHFGIQVAAPFYFVADQTIDGPLGRRSISMSYHGMGDVAVMLNAKIGGRLSWAPTITGTAPTGNTKYGLSTGRVTGNLSNHLELNLGLIAPYIEAGIGNSVPNSLSQRIDQLTATRIFRQPFETLGGMSNFRAGFNIPAAKILNFETSAWDLLPFGDQKLYSRILAADTSNLNPAQFRLYEAAKVIAGSAAIAADHGFTGALDIAAGQRCGVGLSYDRSIRYALDTAAITVSYRFGHVNPSGR